MLKNSGKTGKSSTSIASTSSSSSSATSLSTPSFQPFGRSSVEFTNRKYTNSSGEIPKRVLKKSNKAKSSGSIFGNTPGGASAGSGGGGGNITSPPKKTTMDIDNGRGRTNSNTSNQRVMHEQPFRTTNQPIPATHTGESIDIEGFIKKCLYHRYSRTELMLFRDSKLSRERPECINNPRLMSLGMWKHRNNRSNSGGQQSSLTGSNGNVNNSGSYGSSSGTVATSSNNQHQNYVDHRSISSSHLMPAFAKRKIVGGSGGNGVTAVTNPSVPGSIEKNIKERSRKDSYNEANLGDIVLSPQRSKSINMGCQMPGGPGTERVSSNDHNNRDRRIGSGRLMPRDVTWDPTTDTPGPGPPSTYTRSNSHQPTSSHRYFGSEYTNKNYLSGSNGMSTGGNFNRDMSSDRNVGGTNETTFHGRVFERKTSQTYQPRGNGGPEFESRGGRYSNEPNTNPRNTAAAAYSESHHFQGNLNNSNSGNNRNRGRQSSDHARNTNEEPEWFSGGPTSQLDTIELRGFDDPVESDDENSSYPEVNETGDRNRNGERDKSENSSIDYNFMRNSTAETETEVRAAGINSTTPTKSDTNNNSNDEQQQSTQDAQYDEKNPVMDILKERKRGLTHNMDFNFAAFMDDNETVTKILGQEPVDESSRGKIWFGCPDPKMAIQPLQQPQQIPILVPERNFYSNNMQDMKIFEPIPPVPPIQTAESTSEDTNMQSNTLMDFLQKGAIKPSQMGKGITSVEELEARWRGTPDIHKENEQQQLAIANLCHIFEQQRIQQIQQMNDNESQGMIPVAQQQMVLPQPQPNQQIPLQIQTQTQNLSMQSQPQQQSQPQDAEAFKKILEQLAPNGQIKQASAHGGPSALNQGTSHGGPNSLSQGTPSGGGYPSQHLLMQQQQQRLMQQQGIIPPFIPPQVPSMMKPEELAKLITTTQLQVRQQLRSTEIMQKVIQVTNARNEIIKKPEAQMLLQGLARGEFTPQHLLQQMVNPNKREVIGAVLNYLNTSNSRVTSPNLMLGPVPQQPPLLSPVPGITGPIPVAIKQPQMVGPAVPIPGVPPQRIPSPRELQYHTQTIMQNALIKKRLEEQTENYRRRQHEMQQKQQHQSASEQHQHSQQQPQQQQHQQLIQQQRQQVNSPTPALAFTPTSVLRKMTAEKDFQSPTPTPIQHHQTGHIQQMAQPQPRMILGGGCQQPSQQHQHQMQQQQQLQQMMAAGGQMQPPNAQQPLSPPGNVGMMRGGNQLKWNNPNMNQMNKPMGRPILKGGPSSQPSPQTQQIIGQHKQSQQQPPQSPQQQPMMPFASKIEFQQMQQIQQMHRNKQMQQQQQQATQPQQQQQQQVLNQIQQQILQQRRAAAVSQQRVQMQQQIQQYQQHMMPPGDQPNIHMNNIGGSGPIAPPHQLVGQQSSSNNNAIINYQRDGRLSPTSNQLARWFSPELLAQASAGKLPSLSSGQALSLEEFERSIQHSSATTVQN